MRRILHSMDLLLRLNKERLPAQRLRLHGERPPDARRRDQEVVVLDADLLAGVVDDARALGLGVDGGDAALDDAHVGDLQGGNVGVAGPGLGGVGGGGEG